MTKKFEAFKDFYNTISFKFSIVCFSETWGDDNLSKNSCFQLQGYNVLHQVRKNRKGGGGAL